MTNQLYRQVVVDLYMAGDHVATVGVDPLVRREVGEALRSIYWLVDDGVLTRLEIGIRRSTQTGQ